MSGGGGIAGLVGAQMGLALVETTIGLMFPAPDAGAVLQVVARQGATAPE